MNLAINQPLGDPYMAQAKPQYTQDIGPDTIFLFSSDRTLVPASKLALRRSSRVFLELLSSGSINPPDALSNVPYIPLTEDSKIIRRLLNPGTPRKNNPMQPIFRSDFDDIILCFDAANKYKFSSAVITFGADLMQVHTNV